ncbi:MAG TPA: phosphodiester glycosidase family protein, partial [Allocoleopsis sp.]
KSSFTLALGKAFVAEAASPAISQSGNRIALNGHTYVASWSQRQEQIGIADAGLIQAMGIELLNTNDATQQPIEWFSDQRTTPLSLAAWRNGGYRYLDIAPLSQQFGLRAEINGNLLNLSTPGAKITGVRQGRQSWGDRVVVELDGAAPWQVDEEPGETVITIDAQLDPAVQRFIGGAGNQLTSLKVESSQNRSIIRIGIPNGIRPRVWSIPNPNRLLIDVRPDWLVERNILWAPGVRWQQQFMTLRGDRFPVVWLEIDPRQPGVKLKPIVSNTTGVAGTAPLMTTAQQSQAIAAINGGFFNRNTRLPLGAIRREEEWVSGPILGRGAIGWNDAGEITVGRLKLQESLTTDKGAKLPIVYLNSGYVGAGVYRHTRAWGSTYTPILNHELLVTVEDGKVTQQQQSTQAGQNTVPIPANGYLLVIRDDASAAQALTLGTKVELEAATQPTNFSQYSEVMGAGPLLIQNRQMVMNPSVEEFSAAFQQQAAPRSVIAATAEGKLMLVTVHNRVNGVGPTLAEVAQLMQQFGVVNALNLDGGSSSTLYLGGSLLDRAPSTAARVHNGIGVFIQPD